MTSAPRRESPMTDSALDTTVVSVAPMLRALGAQVQQFQFNGGKMFAIRQDDWVAAGAKDVVALRLRDHIVGRLICSGEVFVVFGDPGFHPKPADQSVVQRLTPRELKVGCLIAEGLTDKEIARKLGISQHTVREHCRRACGKLGISKRSALVRCLFAARLSTGLPIRDQNWIQEPDGAFR